MIMCIIDPLTTRVSPPIVIFMAFFSTRSLRMLTWLMALASFIKSNVTMMLPEMDKTKEDDVE